MSNTASFVKNQGLLPQPVANSVLAPVWTMARFVEALRHAGIHNVGAGFNAESWYQEVKDAASAGCLTFDDYVSVRAKHVNARFCHRAALEMAIANYGQ